jgi:hypothetical protein
MEGREIFPVEHRTVSSERPTLGEQSANGRGGGSALTWADGQHCEGHAGVGRGRGAGRQAVQAVREVEGVAHGREAEGGQPRKQLCGQPQRRAGAGRGCGGEVQQGGGQVGAHVRELPLPPVLAGGVQAHHQQHAARQLHAGPPAPRNTQHMGSQGLSRFAPQKSRSPEKARGLG